MIGNERFSTLRHRWVFVLIGLPILGALFLPASAQTSNNNPCPVNPYTSIQWIYDPSHDTCTYPKIIAGRGDTGQQTDIVMSSGAANEYAQSLGTPAQLFLIPAHLLNNRSLSNMSDEALAALVYAQVYVEEKWFKDYNWVHPYWNSNVDPVGGDWPDSTSLNGKRSMPVIFGAMNDWAYTINSRGRPYHLGGFGFGPANQLFGQTWDSAQWFLEYLTVADNRYGESPRPIALEKVPALQALSRLMTVRDEWLYGPDVPAMLRNELLSVDQSQFWNVLRFVWAAARHREGAYSDSRSETQKSEQAIDYNQLLNKPPGGRPVHDVSAFALMTTVYTDSIIVPDVTGFGKSYSGRDNRSNEDWRNFISERNKAIRNVELLGSTSAEGMYRIQQSLGVGPFKTMYDDPVHGDFLPYSREEVQALVNALCVEMKSDDVWVSGEALRTLDNAKLLQDGYRFYIGKLLDMPGQQSELLCGSS